MLCGVLHPFFDRTTLLVIGNMKISGGVISMLSLMLKGVLTVLAGYILIATTTIEKICRALRILHVPKAFVTVILLIFRYVTLLLSEARRITQAYSLRAPGQKGVQYKVWGPLLGQLLLRSMDRANDVYDSMLLRGFDGEFRTGRSEKLKPADILWPLLWMAVILLLRLFPVVEWIGGLFV
jgi:cobalt/nickel transport system permease protein